MRDGDWSLALRARGAELAEHDIDGHTCVTAASNETFEIVARYHGQGQVVYYIYIDGQAVDPWMHHFDPDKNRVEKVLRSWEKSSNGQTTRRTFLFEPRAAEDNENRPGEVDWSHGIVTLRAYRGRTYVRQQSRLPTGNSGASSSGNSGASTSRGPAVDEQTMVKSGLSTTAGAGQATFVQEKVRQAGTVSVTRADPNDAPIAELKLYYRDSFFMLLREDTCCGGACKRRVERAAQLREAADALDASAGSSAGGSGAGTSSGGGSDAARGRKRKAREIRDVQISVVETRARLESNGMGADEAPIDLLSSDDDDDGGGHGGGGNQGGDDAKKPLIVD